MKKAVLVLFIVKKQQVLFRVSLTTVENLEPKIRSIYPSIQQLNVWDNVSFLIIREDVGLGNIFICFFPHSSPPPPYPHEPLAGNKELLFSVIHYNPAAITVVGPH